MAPHQTFVIPSPRLPRERDLLFSSAPNCGASGLSLPCHPGRSGPIFSSAPDYGESGLSLSCHPDRSSGALCRCGVEGSRHGPRPSNILSSRPERSDLLFRAVFWRGGPFFTLSSRPQQRRLLPLWSGGIAAQSPRLDSTFAFRFSSFASRIPPPDRRSLIADRPQPIPRDFPERTF